MLHLCECVCHGTDGLHLIQAIVTGWIVSMMCQIAGHTLSNFIERNNTPETQNLRIS